MHGLIRIKAFSKTAVSPSGYCSILVLSDSLGFCRLKKTRKKITAPLQKDGKDTGKQGAITAAGRIPLALLKVNVVVQREGEIVLLQGEFESAPKGENVGESRQRTPGWDGRGMQCL